MNVRDEEHKRVNSNGAPVKMINSSATSQCIALRSGGRRRDLGFHKVDLLHAVSSVEVDRNCAGSMDDNLIIWHRIQQVVT